MEHFAVIAIGIVLLITAIIAATRSKRPKQGRVSGEGTAILREQPSADAPTPARSVTASPAEKSEAEKRTPPA
jgi:hypothetical protein